MPHTPIDPDSEAGILIQRLGYAGLVPFVGLALLLWIVSIEVHAFVSIALTGYAALIASFLGVFTGALVCATTPRSASCTWSGA